MRQTTLSVPLEVKPESSSVLAALIDQFKLDEDHGGSPQSRNFERIADAMPGLHFMSMSVFPAAEYDPLFILEANFDGAPGPFFAQLDAAYGDDIRAMLRCCKRPRDRTGALYDAVTAADAKVSVAAYLEARTQRPSVFHHGNRGLTRAEIIGQHQLFLDLRDALDAPPVAGQPGPHALAPETLHAQMRAGLLPAHPWLDQPDPPRITAWDNLLDWGRMAGFAIFVLLLLSSPGLLLGAILRPAAFIVTMLGTLLLLGALIAWYWRGLPGTETTAQVDVGGLLGDNIGKILLVLAIYLVGTALLVSVLYWIARPLLHWATGVALLSFADALKLGIWSTVYGVAGLALFSLPLLLLLVRWSEMRDSPQDAPHIDPRMLRDMLAREDWVTQNHMGSIVLIKPGVMRTLVIRLGHLGLGLALRLLARDGYLGSMRTVHFAHWAFLNNNSRLLFFSNFDHSWGSYLDDFIEKAHGGLTLAWGCGTGFPATRFLILDGASHGRQFKNWALASRAVSRFWFSAYPALTVDQIERNYRIAKAMRRKVLSAQEAKTWMQDL
jgi:hypothetical protein